MSDAARATAEAVMRSVAELLDIPEGQLGEACRIMRERITAFLFGEEYKDARDSMVAGTLHPKYAMALLVTEAVESIAQLPGVTRRGARS